MGEFEVSILSSGITESEAKEWDHFVESVDQSDVAQLSAWSRVRGAADFSPVYVFVRFLGELVAGAQVLVRRIPVVGSIGYLSYGPVMADGLDERAGACAAICAGLHTMTRDHRVRFLFVQPPVGADDCSAELLRSGFRPSDGGIAPPASLRIDLSASEEELRGALGKTLRNWTPKWAARGVTVRVGSADDLPTLAELITRSARHQGYEPMSQEYLEQQYGELAPSGNAVLFVGEVDGKPVAIDLFTRCGNTLRDRLRGLDRDSDAAKLRVPAAIKWFAMLWSKEHGLRWFDFGGVRIDIAETLLAGKPLDMAAVPGSDEFKLSFGGAPYLLPPAVELVRPRLLLRLYDITQRSQRGRTMLQAARRHLRGGQRD